MSRARRLSALLLLPLVLLLSSCIRMQSGYTIKSADRVDVALNFGVLKSMASQGSKPTTTDNVCEDTTGGQANPAQMQIQDAKREAYDDGTYIGCKVTGWIKPGTAGGTSITLADGVWTFKVNSAGDAGQDTTTTKQMFSDFKTEVTFPGKVLTHNGSSTVKGRTVTWTDVNDMFSADGLQATGQDAKPGQPLWVWAVVGLAAIGIIVGGVLWFLQNKRAKAAQQQSAQQGQWTQPGYGRNQGYGPNPGYGSNQGYDMSQGYPGAPGQPGYPQGPADPNQTYPQGAWNSPQGFGQPGPDAAYGQQVPGQLGYGQQAYGQYIPGDGSQGLGGQPASQPTAEWSGSASSASWPSSQPSADPNAWGGQPQQPWGQPQQPQAGWGQDAQAPTQQNPWGPPQQ